MSYIFLLEQGEESSVECFSDIPACALSNGTSTLANASSPDNGTDACHASQSGMTCKPSMATLGAGASTLCAGASHVRTSAQPVKAQESTGSGLECGTTWPESLARYDRATSSWKTRQYLLLEGLEEFSETWPRWGMMRNGECWGRAMSEARIGEIVYGYSLPTPTASDHKRTPIKMEYAVRPKTKGVPDDLAKWALRESGLNHGRLEPALWEWVMGWPITWTELNAAATDKFRQWLLSHSTSFPLVLKGGQDE